MGTTGQSITLANSIIGVGILAMPFCFQQCGVLLATAILLFMGLISRLCCYFLLKSALIARRRNFEFLAFHVFGPAGKFAVEVGIIGFLMGTCIAYFVVVGDLGPQIIAKLLNINQSDILRTSIMVIVSLVCVLPLGLLRNVDSLSNVSAATICFYFCLVIKVVSEAASQLVSGPWRGCIQLWRPDGLLQCVPIFSMALFCQTQLFEIFESLPTISLEKMNIVTKNAINICTGVYFTLGLFGYMAFCTQNISGNILMSLSPTMASDVIKLGFVMSLAFSFPLIIFPCRASLYSFLYRKALSTHHDHLINHSIPETTFRCMTVAIILVALSISLLIPNIELVLGLLGSTIGVLVCVVFPAACFLNITMKNTNERLLAKGVVILGLVILVLGTYANLQAAEKNADRYDDKITQERIDKMVEDFFERAGADHKLIAENKPLIHEEVDKNSEVQPPNPVPPESHSHEKQDVDIKKEEKSIEKPKDKIIPDDKNSIDKVSETHPKNLQTKLDEFKSSNGVKVDNEDEPEKPKKENVQVIPDKTQEKIDLKKKQQLIETIKQHGEEQKELIKEQKEILDELIKTKKELQQNQKEIEGVEAKKKAVESIQKIADIAIKSLSGVTDKPLVAKDDKLEPLEKLANEAVQEIAKTAVEAIEEIKEQPQANKKEVNVLNNIIENAKLRETVNNIAPENPPVLNTNENSQSVNIPVPKLPKAESLVKDDVAPELNNINAQQANPNIPIAQLQANSLPVLDQNINKPISNINPPVLPNLVQTYQSKDLSVMNNEQNKNVPQQNTLEKVQNIKQKDTQKTSEMAMNVAQNIPIPIVRNGNMKNKIESNIGTAKVKEDVQNDINNNGAKNSLNLESNIIRQKREVIDCTETISLAPKEQEICKTLRNNKIEEHSEDILPLKVDLSDGLNKPLDIIHHSRSLKSFEDTEKKR